MKLLYHSVLLPTPITVTLFMFLYFSLKCSQTHIYTQVLNIVLKHMKHKHETRALEALINKP